jgi:major type 1 subunit fimbrin (pilin)
LKKKLIWTLLLVVAAGVPLSSHAQVAPVAPTAPAKPAPATPVAKPATPAAAPVNEDAPAPEANPDVAQEEKIATGGTITFKGEITSPTCIINGGNGGENFEVDLPKVSTADLREAGKTAGDTKFNVSLSGCGYTGGKVRTYFQDGATVDARSGRLKLQDTEGGTSAANVQVELANAEGTAISVGEDQSTAYFPIDEAGAANMEYVARYHATGKSKAGMVRSQVTYVLQYE